MSDKQKAEPQSPRLAYAMVGGMVLLTVLLLVLGIRQKSIPPESREVSSIENGVSPGEFSGDGPTQIIASRLVGHEQFNATPLHHSWNPFAENFTRLKIEIETVDDPASREELADAFVLKVGQAEIPAWLAYLHGIEPSGLAENLNHRLVRRWAAEDPQAVADWLARSPDRLQNEDDLAVVWAGKDLTNAVLWAQSLPDETRRHQELETVANEAVRTDPLAALQLAVDLPASSGRDDLIRRATMEWVSSDAAGAVAWAEQIPDAKLRAQVLASAAVTWSEQDPAAAARLVVTELPPSRLQNDAVVSIVQRWTQTQPGLAAGWVEKFPAGTLRHTAIENVFALWSQKDAAAAQNWLAQQVNQVN